MIRSDIFFLQEESERWTISLENKFKQVQENAKALPRQTNYGLRLSPRHVKKKLI
jgi:hypothetical protein